MTPPEDEQSRPSSEVAESPPAGLEEIGYSQRWSELFAPHGALGHVPARVIRSNRGSAVVLSPRGVARAKVAGALRKHALGPLDLPTVGDWVAVDVAPDLEVPLIHAVLPRASAIVRGDPNKTSGVQIMAANIDVVFIVHPIADPPNLRRIERELSLSWESGAAPVIVLTKADLSSDVEAARQAVASIALETDVLVTNARAAVGLGQITERLTGHRTAVLIGPSGAGKSTIINGLLGEQRQATREVRVADGRGRHTTVARELVQIPGGGVLIDTPGLRSLGLTGSEEGISAAFADIEELARSCRFADCTHDHEPGCAVKAAVESGRLAVDRLVSYRKLLLESQVVAAKTDARARAQEARKEKILGKAIKNYKKQSGRG